MSEIITTEAIVLSKVNFSDTSKIAQLYTDELGKISGIIKGGRGSNAKVGRIIDPLNVVQVVLYKKENRDIQIISSADLVLHFPKLREDYERLNYALAVIELVYQLAPEHETNKKLFRGTKKILTLFDKAEEEPPIIFARYFFYFLTELGYEISIAECISCGVNLNAGSTLAFNYSSGFLCSNCMREHIFSLEISSELFTLISHLKTGKSIGVGNSKIKTIIRMLLEYLKHHVPDFKGLKSISLIK